MDWFCPRLHRWSLKNTHWSCDMCLSVFPIYYLWMIDLLIISADWIHFSFLHFIKSNTFFASSVTSVFHLCEVTSCLMTSHSAATDHYFTYWSTVCWLFSELWKKTKRLFLLNLKRKKKTSWHQKTINSEIRTVSKSFHWSITALINGPITSALICFHSPTSTHNQYSDTLWLLISFVLLLFTFKMN